MGHTEGSFVIQEHHARSLHWDFRLERDGVLVSWAVPKGLPTDRGVNHLAVHVEDHPLSTAASRGTIPDHEYGAGTVTIWDSGHLRVHRVDRQARSRSRCTARGSRGATACSSTDGDNWMIHRIDPAPPGWEPLPELVRPMLATPPRTSCPTADEDWAYEFKWDGVRAVVYVEGGRVRVAVEDRP